MTTKEVYKNLVNEFIQNKKELSEDIKLILQEKQQFQNNDIKTLKLLNEIRIFINENMRSMRKEGFESFWTNSINKEKELLAKKEELRKKGKTNQAQKIQKEIEKERQRRNYLRTRYLHDIKKKKK